MLTASIGIVHVLAKIFGLIHSGFSHVSKQGRRSRRAFISLVYSDTY